MVRPRLYSGVMGAGRSRLWRSGRRSGSKLDFRDNFVSIISTCYSICNSYRRHVYLTYDENGIAILSSLLLTPQPHITIDRRSPPLSAVANGRTKVAPYEALFCYLIYTATHPSTMPAQDVPRPYPLIDTDPHAGRVIRYMRPSDYGLWAGATVAGPGLLYLYGELCLLCIGGIEQCTMLCWKNGAENDSVEMETERDVRVIRKLSFAMRITCLLRADISPFDANNQLDRKLTMLQRRSIHRSTDTVSIPLYD